MANIANINLVNGLNVTTVATALSGSNGDGVPAIWRVNTSKPVFARPLITLMARDNKARTARHEEMKIVVPYTVTNTTTSQEEAVAKAMFFGQWILPSNAPSSVHDDLIHYVYSMVADATVVPQMKTGYSFT